MSLHKHGASKGATIAFLLSTPQTGVDSIFVTLSLLGPVFAIFRPVAALITGLVGGTFVELFAQRNGAESAPPAPCTDACCRQGKHNRVIRGLKYGFITLPRDIGKSLIVGLLVAAFISALVPDGFFAEKLGTGIFPLIAMMFLGIPVYVCATASVPVAAALILKGLSPGAALVFLLTGPATNAASFVTIWKTLGKTTAILYLAIVAGCALMSGLLFDYAATGINIEVAAHHGWMLPDLLKSVSALILFALLGFALLHNSQKTHPDSEPDNSTSNPHPSPTQKANPSPLST